MKVMKSGCVIFLALGVFLFMPAFAFAKTPFDEFGIDQQSRVEVIEESRKRPEEWKDVTDRMIRNNGAPIPDKDFYPVILSSTVLIGQVPEGHVRLKNRWYNQNYIHVQNRAPEQGPVELTWPSAIWKLEPIGGIRYRIKNSFTSEYLNNEAQTLQTSAIQPNWNSAMWELEPVGQFYRIMNLWTKQYLHNQNGRLELGEIEPGWWSAMWSIVAVLAGDPVVDPTDPGTIIAGSAAGAITVGTTILDKVDIPASNPATGGAAAAASGTNKVADTGTDVAGSLTTLCKVLTKVSAPANAAVEKQQQAAAEQSLFKNWAKVLHEAQQESGISVADVESVELATVMAQVEADIAASAAQPAEPEEEIKESWTAFDIARTTLEVAGLADPIGVTGVVAAYLHPVCGTDDAKRSSQGSFCWKDSAGRGVGVIPIACNPATPDHQAGLCYQNCEEGFHGVGPVCWTEKKVSIPRGAGVIPAGCPSTHPSFEGGLCYASCGSGWRGAATICYQDCPSGYRDDGLYCGKPEPYGRGAGYPAWDMDVCEAQNGKGNCEWSGAIIYPKCKPGFHAVGCCVCSPDCPDGWEDIGVSCKKPLRGRGVGVARNVCAPNVPEMDAGLCYEPCPDGYNGVGPVCWTTTKVSQPRGVGLIPDQCPASHPHFQAGLCYKDCPSSDLHGVGPVCWGGCDEKYPAECGAGCATSGVDCGLVVADMVASPFEVIASIASLGGYSLADKAKDSAKIAAKQAKTALSKSLKQVAKEGTEEAAETMAKKISKQIATGLKKNIDKLSKAADLLADRKAQVKKALQEGVFDPAKDRAKQLAKKAADNLKLGKAAKDAPKPKALLTLEEITDQLKKARKTIADSNDVRAIKLARSCADLGMQIDKDWIQE